MEKWSSVNGFIPFTSLLYDMLKMNGLYLFNTIKSLKEDISVLYKSGVTAFDINDNLVIQYPFNRQYEEKAMEIVRREIQEREGKVAAASVSYDIRDGGLFLYRYDDHPAVDFKRIEDDERILFAHSSGFIAKTKAQLPDEEIKELLSSAIGLRFA